MSSFIFTEGVPIGGLSPKYKDIREYYKNMSRDTRLSNIVVFKNGYYPTMEYRGTYRCSEDFVLRRDLVQITKSTITVVDVNNTIQPQDLIIFWFQEALRIGKVLHIDRKQAMATLSFVYGIDSHLNEIEFFSNPDIREFTYDNKQSLIVSSYLPDITTPQYFIAPDGVLGVDVGLRQLLRRRHLQENYSTDGENLYISITTVEDADVLNIRLDDARISSNKILKIGSDTFTRLVLYDTDNLSNYQAYQMLTDAQADGSMNIIAVNGNGYNYTIDGNYYLPTITRIDEVSSTEYNNLDYAKDLFRQSEYDNEIIIKVPINNNLFVIGGKYTSNITIDGLLGQEYNIYLPDSDISIKTCVSAYEYSAGFLTITFGMARTRLTDIINKYINKD